jgi:hypothetical protein
MNLKSYLKKIISLLSCKLLYHRNFIYPNLYLFNLDQQDLTQAKHILFYFATDEYMHLGDHLFFLPLIKAFIDSGYEVTVAPTLAMLPLFSALGITVIQQQPDFSAYDVLISRVELVQRLSKYKSILVNISKNLIMPVCDQLLHDFSQLFALKAYQSIDFSCFKTSDVLDRFELPYDKKLILFNLYCDSSAFLITQTKLNTLLRLIRQYATNPEYEVVFIGSAQDKLKDKVKYDFKFIDLRGKTSVVDIFNMVACKNVSQYIGFDAFVMHVFSLFHKKSLVVFRGRLLKKQREMLKKFHVNLFSQDDYVKLVDVSLSNSGPTCRPIK